MGITLERRLPDGLVNLERTVVERTGLTILNPDGTPFVEHDRRTDDARLYVCPVEGGLRWVVQTAYVQEGAWRDAILSDPLERVAAEQLARHILQHARGVNRGGRLVFSNTDTDPAVARVKRAYAEARPGLEVR